MKKEITTIAVLLLAFVVVAAPFAYAAVTSPVSLTEGPSERRSLTGLPTQNVSAQGGNVTQVNIDVLTITKNWQGYYGNITGEITLDDASNNTFYNWTLTNVNGEVYATRNESADFTTVDCTSGAEISAEETYLGHISSDGDSVTNTFSQNYASTIQVGAVTTSANCNATTLYTNSAKTANDFWEVLLADDAGSIIYTAIIDEDTAGFDGSTYDFQLLVGENEHAGSEGSTPYYIFVEIE